MPLLSVLLALSACSSHSADVKTPDPDDEGGTVEEAPTPISVSGFGTDVAIAAHDGYTQGEPSALALPDGSIVAAWMEVQDNGYDLYVVTTRSEDGGATWTDPVVMDADQWGWQNDPAFAYGNGVLMFTWLAIESSRGDVGSIYCVDSTDGGATWSQKVKLSTESDSVDRQWMAQDASGKVVITWDSFAGARETMQYSESTAGCAGFSAPETVASGVFLNGVPAIDTDGNVWASRNEFGNRSISNILSRKTDDGWEDTTVEHYDYPNGSYYAQFAEHEEEEESPEAFHPMNLSARSLAVRRGHAPPRDEAYGTFDGEYSPILAALPGGGLAIVSLITEAGDPDYADVSFSRFVDGEVADSFVISDDGGSVAQMEPWVTVDAGGGIHAMWYDATEGDWRLYGASSTDGGETFTPYTIGDNLFSRGFDEQTQADYDAWVGHFQGLVATDDHVVAIFGDSHSHGISHIYADASVP